MSKITLGLKTLFADSRYILFVAFSSIVISVLFMYSMGALFFDPLFFNYFEFFEDGLFNIALNFIYVSIIPVFAGTSIAVTIYKLIKIKKSIAREGSTGILGLSAAAFVTTCSNCVPVALYSMGVTYGLFQAILAPFVLPFKILTILVITLSFYFATNSLGQYCKLKIRR